MKQTTNETPILFPRAEALDKVCAKPKDIDFTSASTKVTQQWIDWSLESPKRKGVDPCFKAKKLHQGYQKPIKLRLIVFFVVDETT